MYFLKRAGGSNGSKSLYTQWESPEFLLYRDWEQHKCVTGEAGYLIVMRIKNVFKMLLVQFLLFVLMDGCTKGLQWICLYSCSHNLSCAAQTQTHLCVVYSPFVFFILANEVVLYSSVKRVQFKKVKKKTFILQIVYKTTCDRTDDSSVFG